MSQPSAPSTKTAERPIWYKRAQVKAGAVFVFAAALVAFFANIATIAGFISSINQMPNPTSTPSTFYTYTAKIPGPGCKGTRGRWVKADGVATCLVDHLTLSTDASEGIGQVFFYGDQHLPTNYKIDVDISGLSDGACAGVITRNADSRKGGYAYQACADGNWLIVKYDLSDTPFPLLKGKNDHRSVFHLAAITQGNNLVISLDGREVGQVNNEGEFPDTDSISLFVTPTNSGTGQAQANFQNFAFTELPA